MLKAKRNAAEMKTVLEFQKRFELELTETKCQAGECQAQAGKFMKKTRADYQKMVADNLKVINLCDRVIAEMKKVLQDMPSHATQPATPPPAKKTRATQAKGRL